MKTWLKTLLAAGFAAALAFASTPQLAFATASTQTTHQYLCAPEPSVGAPGPRRVVNTSSTAATQPSYTLNGAGCAVIAAADVGFFLAQGYTQGQGVFELTQTAIPGVTTSSTSTLVLPAYAFITALIIEETGGAAASGGVEVGDSASPQNYASVTVGANATVYVKDASMSRSIFASAPVADTILISCETTCTASLNVSILYSYY